MRVRVRLFATFREIVGSAQLTWTLEPGATAEDLVGEMIATFPKLAAHRPSMLIAVNESFASPRAALRDGDELALMPPVSGGMGRIEVSRAAIDVEALLDSVRRHDAGAVVLFLGTVRSDPGVKALDYEVYRPMALKKMAEIADLAKAKFGVLDVAIVHRLGRVAVGRPSVAVAVAAAHRREAFAACEWSMDEVKSVVPIWKTEAARRRPRRA